MILDFHNHFFPAPYLEEIAKGEASASATTDEFGRTIMVTDGDYNIIVEEHHNPVARMAAMDAAGVDMQCLSMTVPGVHSERPAMGVKLAQIVNDGFANIIAQHPDRFTALAILPLQDANASVIELERAVTQGGLRGGTLFSHINGKNLDHLDYWPLYEKAIELDVPLFVHPIIPVGRDSHADLHDLHDLHDFNYFIFYLNYDFKYDENLKSCESCKSCKSA